jgi:tetratricopeptide (TPR) repeat protein/tRNA A-37 threonylcarbamoyl transferase component Bud32
VAADPLEALEERIRVTFARVETSGPLERETLLTELSAADPDVHRAIVRMLDALDPPAFSPGEFVSDRFRILQLLGHGGMGEVYEAEDTVLRERVALKTLPSGLASDARAVERLKREIALARRVTHPNVCRVFDVDQHQPAAGDVVTFFTMELLHGQTLRQRLKDGGRMAPSEALPLVREMAAGLGAAHAAGVVHGDFKPGNVMLVSGTDRSGERLVVTDFGLAHPAQPASAAAWMTAGAGWGTPAYMAPEQLAKGRITPQTDVYALGLVAREMIGEPLDAHWRASIARCLERDPDARFATPAAFVEALGPPTSTVAARWKWIAAAAVVTAAALLGAWLARSPQTARTAASGVQPAPPAAPDRTVALLPLESHEPTTDALAVGRGFAVALTDQLRAIVQDEPVSTRVQVVPTPEVIEADLRSAERAQRTLGANIVVTGRMERDVKTQRLGVTLAVNGAEVVVPAGDAPLVPAIAARLAGVLHLNGSAAAGTRGRVGPVSSIAEESYLRGRGYLSQGKLDAAVDWLERTRAADAMSAAAAAALADALRLKYAASRDPVFIDRAQRAVDQAVRLDPGLSYAHVIRGAVYNDTGQHDRAAREFQEALRLDRTALNARTRLAEVREADGALGDAEASYMEEIALSPRYWSPRVDFASFLIRHGRYADAESHLLTAVQYAPDNVRVIGNLAGLYAFTERFAAAESELKRGLESGPNAIGLNNLAWVYIYENRMDDAVTLLEQAVKTPGADSTHWSNLARAYRWTNRRDQARATYAVALRVARSETSVNPRNARIRSNLACMLAETGQRGEALAEMASALERAPADVSALFRSAIVHELTGDRTAALNALAAAARGGYSAMEIRRYPDLAKLREDRRFVEILTLAPHAGVR